MLKKQKQVLIVLILISLVYTALFIIPDAKGAVDQNMLGVFEPDEYAQYPHVVRMLKPANDFKESIRRFFAYQHYYYGFPFYMTSALLILPLKLINQFDTPQIMLVLRILTGVLPMLAAILIWVYLQDKFQSYYKSILLFLTLATIPAVIKNNLWWHPESLTFLFITLTFFFLVRDDLEFGKSFTLAAVFTGLAVGTKLIGLFFFLTIPVYILYGLIQKRIRFAQAVSKAFLFVAVMCITVIVSNPLLLTGSGREAYLRIQQKQAEAMAFGWFVAYDRGVLAWKDILTRYYGPFLLFAAAIYSLYIGLKNNKLLCVLVTTWFIPFSIYILFFIAIKPIHFFLPIVIPLFSCLLIPLSRKEEEKRKQSEVQSFSYAIILIVGFGIFINLIKDFTLYTEALHRVETSESVQFYNELELDYLSRLPDDKRYLTYRDVRLYVPDNSVLESNVLWGLPDSEFIEENGFDFLLIEKQKILDYTQEDTLTIAQDPEQMQKTVDFYNQAEQNSIAGYTMLYKNDYGLAFVRDDLYSRYYSDVQ